MLPLTIIFHYLKRILIWANTKFYLLMKDDHFRRRKFRSSKQPSKESEFGSGKISSRIRRRIRWEARNKIVLKAASRGTTTTSRTRIPRAVWWWTRMNRFSCKIKIYFCPVFLFSFSTIPTDLTWVSECQLLYNDPMELAYYSRYNVFGRFLQLCLHFKSYPDTERKKTD